MDSSAERSYELKISGESIMIENVMTQGRLTFFPFANGGFSQYIQVRQTFQLKKHTQMKHEYNSNSGKDQSPTYHFAGFDKKLGMNLIQPGEEGQPKMDFFVNTVRKNLQLLLGILDEAKIGGFQDREGYMENKEDKNHFALFRLMKILVYADYETLNNCFSKFSVGTSYKEETIRELFLDVLSQVGTKASMTLLKDLIVSHRLKDESAIQALQAIPFYARHIDVNLLEMYESVLDIEYNDQVKRAAILSFSTLIYQASKTDKLPTEVLEKYVLKYFELFKDSTEYQWQLNYLEGLSNIQKGKVVEYLEPIVKGDQPYSQHIRFLAMWASRIEAVKDWKRVMEVYWPILEDKSQHLELRVAAFVILLLSKPDQNRFNSIASIMEEEPEGSHLYYFFYSTMESLAETKHPGYQIMKQSAKNILQLAKEPTTLMWSGNHLSDYTDPDNHFGGLLQLLMVANPNTGGPNVFYLLYSDHFLGYSHNMLSYYVKVRGIRSTNLELQAFDGKDKLGILQDLLSSYNIEESEEEDEPLHVELIVQFQDKAIMTYYYNETNFLEMFTTLTKAGFGNEFHINFQRFLFPLMHEITGPTDLGVPMAFRIPVCFLFSLHGNFSLESVKGSLQRKFQVDIKYWRNDGDFMVVYNPLGHLWHGVARLHTTLMHLPINFQGYLDFPTFKVSLGISGLYDSVPGLAVHVGSNVFVETLLTSEDVNPKSLLASCPSCLSHHPVIGKKHHKRLESENFELENLRMNLIYRYFDCDVPNIQFYIQNWLWDSFEEDINEKGFSYILDLLKIYNHLMYIPIPGRCGIVLKFSPGAETKGVIISTHVIPDDSESKEKDIITSEYPSQVKYQCNGSVKRQMLSGELVPVYEFTIKYQNSRNALDHYFKMEFSETENMGQSGANGHWIKMCLDAELHYPYPPLDPFKQRDPDDEKVNGSLNMVVGMTNNNECPIEGITLKLLGRAIPVPDKSQQFYKECSDDKNLKEWQPEITHLSPSTPACLAAAIDSTTLRRFELSVEAQEYITDIASKTLYAMYVLEGTYPWGEHIVNSSYSLKEYPVIANGNGFSFEFAPDGLFFIDTFEDNVRDRAVYNFGITSGFNSRFDMTNTEDDEYMERKCVLTTSSVIPLDEMYYAHQMSSCHTLAFAHCHGSSPLFAGFVRKIEDTNLMALSFYNLDHNVEVIPYKNNTFEILVDKEKINFRKEEGYELEENKREIFRIWQRQSKNENDPLYLHILGATTNLMVEYTGYRVVATLTHTYLGNVCGLCSTQSPSRWELCRNLKK